MQKNLEAWQEIIWREWRHCLDPDYANRLFELVADEPVSWKARLCAVFFNAVGGAAIAIVCGAVLTFDWAVLQHFIWTGALIGSLRGYMFSRALSWRVWLNRLSSNTPTGSFSQATFGALFLAAIGGMVFGPVFWLLAAGLFWAMGDVINWMTRGLTGTPQTNLDDRRWWFWWRRRPHLFTVEAALRRACAESAVAQVHWREPLSQLAEAEILPTLPEFLIARLLSKDWTERFVARQHLVRLGAEAAPALQRVAQQDDSPLQQTAVWLLHNIAQTSVAVPAAVPEAKKLNL